VAQLATAVCKEGFRADRASVPTQSATLTSLVAVLLSVFAFGLGCLIGRLRGGRWSGVTSARLNGSGWLVLGISTILVLSFIGPAVPLAWVLIGALGFVVFGIKNLQITGMIVLLVGLSMNLAPVVANGAAPVSELALVSVGDVNDSGAPVIEGIRESSETATAFSAFGDVIPVPLFNVVVSLGDLVMLVALADIAMNLFLRHRTRTIDSGGVTFASTGGVRALPERVAILSPLNLGVSSRPAHAAHRRPRKKAAPTTHIPAHAATPAVLEEDAVIVLDGPTAYVERPPRPTGSNDHVDDMGLSGRSPDPKHRERSSRSDQVDQVGMSGRGPDKIIDLTNPADRRPIIDLTTSPTDDQLCEFLRRRSIADAEFEAQPLRAAGSRRGRAPRRSRTRQILGGVAE
jgi:hypothetical protein